MSTDTAQAPEPSQFDTPPEQRPEDWREREHYRQIRELEKDVRIAKATWEDEAATAKESKAHYEKLQTRLQTLIARGPEKLQRTIPMDDEPKEDDPPVKPAEPTWRDLSLAELGLTKSQITKFEEAGVHNAGELEDLRAGKGIQSVDGIGKKTGEEIEEKLLKYLSETRDKAALENAAEPPEKPPAESEGEATPTEADQRSKQILARAHEINDIPDGSLEMTTSEGAHSAGQTAFTDGSPVWLCPVGPGLEQDDFIRGWLSQARIASYPDPLVLPAEPQ